MTAERCDDHLGSDPGSFSLRLNDNDDMEADIGAGTIGSLRLNAFTLHSNSSGLEGSRGSLATRGRARDRSLS